MCCRSLRASITLSMHTHARRALRQPPRAPPSLPRADLLSKSFKYENKVEVKTSTSTGVTYTAETVVSKPGACRGGAVLPGGA